MKKLEFIILIIFLNSLAFAQEDTSKTITSKSINITEYVSMWGYGLSSNVNISYSKGRSIYSIGPTFGPTAIHNEFESYPNNGTFNLIGFLASYKYNPNPKGKTIDFFFTYDIYYHIYRDKGIFEPLHSSNIYNYKSTEHLLGSDIGYGFNLKFLKRFYLNHNIGIGAYYSYTNFDSEAGEYDSHFGEFNFDLMIKLGLGYEF